MAAYGSQYVKCPFFKDLEERKIICEGIDGASAIVLTFRKRSDTLKKNSQYCNVHYEHCEIYKAVMKKYSRNG